MLRKEVENQQAIALRREGKTYAEILKEVAITKSTLSLWLRDVGLSKRQHQRITEKRIQGALRGAEMRRTIRKETTARIHRESSSEIGKLSKREIFLVGAALYWAEGSKQKEHMPSAGITFTNSDPLMLQFFLRWLQEIGVTRDKIRYELYIHDTAKARTESIREFWSKTLKSRITEFEKVYWKKGKISTQRKRTGVDYFGLIRIRVTQSTDLNRRVAGWVNGICAEN